MTKERAIKMIDEYLLEPNNICKEWVEVLQMCRQALMQEEKHGEWKDYVDSFWGRIGRMDLRCSLCGKRASSFVGGTEDWWDNYKPNYCPNCGAKMDENGGEMSDG